jgi:hypothetical protein
MENLKEIGVNKLKKEKQVKTFLKILAGIGTVVAIVIAAVMFMTAGMLGTADKFFSAVKVDNYDEAYTLLSEDFRGNTSKSRLKEYLTKNSLTKFKEASWGSRSVSGGRGELVGSITAETGGVVPISLGFIKEGDDWRIYSIKKPSSGLQEETEIAPLPSEKEQIKLASEAMYIFFVSVKEQSMSKMYSHMSSLWKKQFTVEKFDKIFNSFYKFGDTLMVLEQYSPQFSEKAMIDEDGVLILKGLFPTKPIQVHFEHKYIYEGLGWKLIGFNVNIK